MTGGKKCLQRVFCGHWGRGNDEDKTEEHCYSLPVSTILNTNVLGTQRTSLEFTGTALVIYVRLGNLPQ